MFAAIVVDKNSVVCFTAEINKNGSYSIVAESTCKFLGICKNIPLAQSGIGDAIKSVVDTVLVDSLKKITNLYVGVPGIYCRIEKSGSVNSGTASPLHRYDLYSNRGTVEYTLEIYALKEYTDAIRAAIDGYGIQNVTFVSQNYAEGLFVIPKFERDNIAIMLNIGYYYTDISVFSGDAQVFNRTLPAGDSFITRDLSTILDIDRDGAEQLKRQFVFGIRYEDDAIDYVRLGNGRLWGFEHRMVSDIVYARLDDRTYSIAKNIYKLKDMLGKNTKAYLMGSGILEMRGVREYIGGRTGLSFENLPLSLVNGSSRYSITGMAVIDMCAEKEKNSYKPSFGTKISSFFHKR